MNNKVEHKEYKAIWVSPEVHKQLKERAIKNRHTLIAELEVILEYITKVESK